MRQREKAKAGWTNDGSGAAPIRIGVSSCLLGSRVRFDGGHKRDAFLVETFGRYVEWVPVCPEVEVGMGIPRETLRLVRQGNDVRMVAIKSGTDHTTAMRRYAKQRTDELAAADLSGYVLKKSSPSCGMERVKVYDQNSVPAATGRGLFAAALLQAFPHLPVEEEGRLCDPRLRENFVERVFAYRRLGNLFRARWTLGDVVAFHTAHKLQILAHSPQQYADLGRLVAGGKRLPRTDLRERYSAAFMSALEVRATARRQVNVLQHMAGYLHDHLDGPSRVELQSLIADYRAGIIPLVVPLTLIRHYVRRFSVQYLSAQTYLDPHPQELMLRNHV